MCCIDVKAVGLQASAVAYQPSVVFMTNGLWLAKGLLCMIQTRLSFAHKQCINSNRLGTWRNLIQLALGVISE